MKYLIKNTVGNAAKWLLICGTFSGLAYAGYMILTNLQSYNLTSY